MRSAMVGGGPGSISGWGAGLLASALFVVGCSDDGNQNDPTTTVPPPTTTVAASTTGGGSSGTTASSLDGGSTTSVKLDAPPATESAEGIDKTTGCEKVDLLFVIDNSGSMADEQANLVASFPGFITAMQAELAETDGYNVGVVTSDEYIFDISCTPLAYGTLVTQTGGMDASNGICSPYSSGGRYMTEVDNLMDKFACAAQVGTSGDGDEHPMEAMLDALSPEQTGKGGCNEGFLRDDALLVVVIITDEEDDHETDLEACNGTPMPGSPGEPGTWFDQMVQIKGEEDNMVILALVGPDEETGAMCPELDKCNDGVTGAEVGDRILEFTRMFTYGFIGPVCEDYGPIFQESIAVIKTACDEFNPPG